jgi:hypothetical protein
MLFSAALVDFMFFPYYKRIGCVPAKKISDAAWKVMVG